MKPAAYYNEIDPYAAQWLRNLIAGGHIAPGEVDERSIEDVAPDDLRGFTQCHFFAGIGGWSHALRVAGWPDDKPVWTGSCPCQPFSSAGKGDGFDDARHLWPDFAWLIGERKPVAIFGEQVAAGNANVWFDLVQSDLEGMGYAFGLVPFTSAGRTSGSELTGWPTPTTEATVREKRYAQGGMPFSMAAALAHWPTPTCNVNPQPETRRGLQNIAGAVKLAGWTMPTTRDWKDTAGMTAQRDGRDRLDQLPRQAFMTGWPTPTASNNDRSPSVERAMSMYRQDGSKAQQRTQNFAAICGPLRLTVFGVMQTGSFVGTENGVQLNPAHSRWLMGFPKAWDTVSPHHEHWQAVTESAGSEATETP